MGVLTNTTHHMRKQEYGRKLCLCVWGGSPPQYIGGRGSPKPKLAAASISMTYSFLNPETISIPPLIMTTLFIIITFWLSAAAWSTAFVSIPPSYPSFSSITKDSVIYALSTSNEEYSASSRPETDLKRLVSKIHKTSRTTATDEQLSKKQSRPRYQLGVGKNQPLGQVQAESTFSKGDQNVEDIASFIPHLQPVKKPEKERQRYDTGVGKNAPMDSTDTVHQRGTYDGNSFRTKKTHLLTKGDEVSARLTRAVWDKDHFDESQSSVNLNGGKQNAEVIDILNEEVKETVTTYEQIDMSVPHSVYSIPTVDNVGIDLVWDLMRYEAKVEAAREPLLVSFLYSTILNHQSLESALAFHLANRLSNPAMLSTQIMSLIREALDADPDFRRSLRADILAVRDRDPACNCLPDVFLYFKGFHALQTYRVSHYLWKCGRRVLAHYLQSQVSQFFQIDIHPNATLGSGIMLDHGTGIVIGETAHLGHNCSVLHHVTLGGSGKKGVDRHPKVGNGVLLGAGASVLGNINIGDGCQVGAGTLVIEDLPPRSVAVGVPAKIIGRFVDVTAQPSIGMNQLGSKESDESIEFNI